MNEILRRSAPQNDPGQEHVISSEARNPCDVALDSSISGIERIPLSEILARGIVSHQDFLVALLLEMTRRRIRPQP